MDLPVTFAIVLFGIVPLIGTYFLKRFVRFGGVIVLVVWLAALAFALLNWGGENPAGEPVTDFSQFALMMGVAVAGSLAGIGWLLGRKALLDASRT